MAVPSVRVSTQAWHRPAAPLAIRAAMRHYFTDIHQVAEGAAASALAAAECYPELVKGKKVGVVLSGGNVDREMFAEILAGDES